MALEETVADLKARLKLLEQSNTKAWEEINQLTKTMRDNMVNYLPAVEKANTAYSSLIEMSKSISELSIEMRAFHRRQDESSVAQKEMKEEFKRHDEEEMKKYDKILEILQAQKEAHTAELLAMQLKQEEKDKIQDKKIDKQNSFRNKLIGGGFVVLFILEQIAQRIWGD
jgi:hypothetical protein